MNKGKKFLLASAFALLVAATPIFNQSTQALTTVSIDDILKEVYGMEHRSHSNIYFKIDSKYNGKSVSEQLASLKNATKTTSISVYVKNEAELIKELQLGLNSVKTSKYPAIVHVPKGNYNVTTSLHIYSNTWLKLDKGAVITRVSSKSFPFIMNGDSNANYYGYNGQSNIIIDGGVWNSNSNVVGTGATTFNIAHGKNIIVENLTIENVYNGHAIDFTADKNILVRNNKFLGYKNTDGVHDYVEAIQVDGFISEKSFHSFGAVDHTLTTNVIIQSNTFNKSSAKGMGSWAVGVGSHSVEYESPYQNIFIKDNSFNEHSYAAIRARNWSNVHIYRNRFNNNKKGVWLDVTSSSVDKYGKTHVGSLKMSNFFIEFNIFSGTKTLNVDTDGSSSKYISNVNIRYNGLYRVTIPNTAYWQVEKLINEYRAKGLTAYGVAVKKYAVNQKPQDKDPYVFVIETNKYYADRYAKELKAKGYSKTYTCFVK